MVDAEACETVDDTLETARVASRVSAGGVQNRAALLVDSRDGLRVEIDYVVDLALHQPFEAVSDADHAGATLSGAECRRADHAIDARGRPPAHDQAERRHCLIPPGLESRGKVAAIGAGRRS